MPTTPAKEILIGTRLGYVKEIKYLGRLSIGDTVYSAAETLNIHEALRFPSIEAAEEAANSVWMLKKEGYAIFEIAIYHRGAENGINSRTAKGKAARAK